MTATKPAISVIIVSYRVPELMRTCLESLHAMPARYDVEIIVVDNAPDDGTASMIAEQFPQVRVLQPGVNIGFARACNLAARRAAGSHLLLLNPDTVVHGRLTDVLLDFAVAHPEGGLYGGRTLTPSGDVDPRSCWSEPTLWSAVCYGVGLTRVFSRSPIFDPESLGRWQRDDVREVGVVTGCLLLAPAAVWRRLGGFDVRFFMYGEDADLSMRARKLGMRPMITPDATITHHLGASSSQRADRTMMVLRSKATLYRKHWSAPSAAFGVLMLVVGAALRAAVERGSAVLGRPSARRPSGSEQWGVVFRRRSEWVGGYPPHEAGVAAA